MKLALFNGSPRGRGSNTTILLKAFLEGYGPGSPEQCYIYRENDETLIKTFVESDTVILAFPLYTDSVPGKVKYFLELLAALDWKGKRLGIIVQSGFPEAMQSSFIAHYFRNLVEKKQGIFLGGVIKSGVEGIQIQPRKMQEKLTGRFRRLGEVFRETGAWDQETMDTLKKPWALSAGRRFIFGLMSRMGLADFYWNYNLKKNKAFNRRFDRPYELGG